MRKTFVALALVLAATTTPALARGCLRNVAFQRGMHSATFSGSVSGYQTCDYRLVAREGQEMRVWLHSRGAVEASHMVDGEGMPLVDGEAVTIENDGSQIVRVGMPRASARRSNRAVPYTIKFDIR